MSDISLRKGTGILLLNHYGFGNVVMSIPLLQAMSQWAGDQFPIYILFNSPEHFELVREERLNLAPLFRGPKYQRLSGLLRLSKDLRGTIDLIIGTPQVPASVLAIMKCMLGARYSAGEAFPTRRLFLSFSAKKAWTRSILDTQNELAHVLGLGTPLKQPSITLRETELKWAKSQLSDHPIARSRPIIGVHCSSVSPGKKWPPELFGRVIILLKAKFPNLGVAGFGTRSERGDTDITRAAAGEVTWMDGVGRWRIRESLAMVKQCELVLSGDTGIMHMGSAVGVKTLSIFGPTSPKRVAPTYNGGLFVAPESSCHPCYRDKWKHCDCIRLVRPERVTELAERLLTRLESCSSYEH